MRKMKFSERNKLKDFSKIIQVDSMDEELRISLWNALDLLMFHSERIDEGLPNEARYNLFRYLWSNYFKKTYDSLPRRTWGAYCEIKKIYFSCQWYEVYDFIEEILKYQDGNLDSSLSVEVIEKFLNSKLEEENSAYRFIDGIACEITNKQEIAEVEKALNDDDFPFVKEHLTRALELLSDKQKPDYRNSIKESISAVENIACLLAKKEKTTLGIALSELEKKGKLHNCLKKGFSSIYDYTSDDSGIRHALMDEPTLNKFDAYLFFLLCTSFTNYLKTKF